MLMKLQTTPDPFELCDFFSTSQSVDPSLAWADADCDGDGVLNGSDPMPLDPCVPAQEPGYTGYNDANVIWQAADCDMDGDANLDEVVQGSDPYCDQSTIANPGGSCCDPADTTAGVDCDGDGVDNAQEIADGTNASDPCEFVGANQNTIPSDAWLMDDCDGDGLTNPEEVNGPDGDLQLLMALIHSIHVILIQEQSVLQIVTRWLNRG